jgi:nicotinamide-nucleotide amidase
LKTFGVTEAAVDEMISPALSCAEAEIGIFAKPDGIQLRLVAKGCDRGAAEEKLKHTEASLRNMIGAHVWGVDDETLVGVIGTLLGQQEQTLATMESYTGGVLAAMLEEDPGTRGYYRGGFVVASEDMLTRLKVDAVPWRSADEAALAMASASRQSLGASIGIGIAGPWEQQGQPATVALAVIDAQRKRTRGVTVPPLRREMKQWVAVAALFELRQLLLVSG